MYRVDPTIFYEQFYLNGVACIHPQLAATRAYFESDEFRMYGFKIRPCLVNKSHDWTLCPFIHRNEKARRRDPRKCNYVAVSCPEFRLGHCTRGDGCPFAHGVFEYWLHPARYRTRICSSGFNCTRKVCFFAHSVEQLRVGVRYRIYPAATYLNKNVIINDNYHYPPSPPPSPVGGQVVPCLSSTDIEVLPSVRGGDFGVIGAGRRGVGGNCNEDGSGGSASAGSAVGSCSGNGGDSETLIPIFEVNDNGGTIEQTIGLRLEFLETLRRYTMNNNGNASGSGSAIGGNSMDPDAPYIDWVSDLVDGAN